MKRLSILLLALAFAFTVQSCDVLKQSVSTTAELYVGEINDQPVQFVDKAGYLHHFVDMKLPGFWAEYVKGVTFAPIKDFDFDAAEATSLAPSEKFKESADGKKLVWVQLFSDDGELLIKPYRRELH